MKTVLLILSLALSSGLMAEGYNASKAHDDSVFIYQIYHDQIEFLEHATKDQNYQAWYNRSNHDDSITTCAKLRLKRWNKGEYQFVDTKEFEGFGTAFTFPNPGNVKPNIIASIPGAGALKSETIVVKKAKFSITDTQTKFITRPDGKTRIPYVDRTYFDESGLVVSVEHLYALNNY